ncbi:MAG TPA: hypothetical protein VIF59_01170 [Methylomirabilota bacterium]|jgi:hypothetical protein
MTLRETAARIATQFEGRCTCSIMDPGMDCPWCQVFYDVLQGNPPTPPAGAAPGGTSRAPRAA